MTKIEVTIRLDERKQKPYWSSRLVHDDKVLLEVVSQTFDFKDAQGFISNYERCNNRMMKELINRKDFSALRLLLINKD